MKSIDRHQRTNLEYRSLASEEHRCGFVVKPFARSAGTLTGFTVGPEPPVHTLPLCVDLDGTLIASDTLYESLLGALRRWDTVPRLLAWLVRGKAHVKARLAERGSVDPALLPYRPAVLEYLEGERKRGRKIVLVTAADRRIACEVAAHLGLFDDVIASDGKRNLKAAAKAEVLVQRFGEGGFSYAGDDVADLEVWRRAGGAVLVDVPRTVAADAARLTRVERRIEGGGQRLRAVLRAIRPHQWSKNLLVFVPILTASGILDGLAWLKAVTMFCAFSATASSIYLVNDLADLEADRRHPRKRRRPFASGSLRIPAGLLLAPLLLMFGLLLGAAAGNSGIIALYAACSIAYSMVLKALPLVDLFTLATMYSLRLFGGGEATGYRVSMWLLAFSSFLFLSLAAVKRVGELQDMARAPRTGTIRRGYSTADLSMVTVFGVAAAFSSSIVLALYVQSQDTVPPHRHPEIMWVIVPLILFWQCRLWLATARGYMHDDPIVFAVRDWVSWITAACVVLVFALSIIWRSGD